MSGVDTYKDKWKPVVHSGNYFLLLDRDNIYLSACCECVVKLKVTKLIKSDI